MASHLYRQGSSMLSQFARSVRRTVVVPSTSFARSAALSTSTRRCTSSEQVGTAKSTLLPRSTTLHSAEDFIKAIAKPRRGDLQSVLSALGEEKSIAALRELNGVKLKGAGVPIKERRYFLWCLERFKQGQDLRKVAYDVKPKKKVRGWGPRVQNGKRVRGIRRPGEK